MASGLERLRCLYSAPSFLPFFLLQLWDTVRGQLAFQHTCPRPLNCVAFHPEGQVMAVGSWAGSFSFFHVDGLKAAKVRSPALLWGRKAKRSGVEDMGLWTSTFCFTLGLF